ncbi:hypothetical protein CBR_g58651 [Chara braunii]|uniref:Uncharacterized protein n=1 Tax=Chara braunii TaxID=69332 RepID=A0A388MER7_CHABU|nr:hypothetical protein CBR_g58651 [Chara braunii]|eukprot:GBG93068.1 hypothetical protein CBR_g58651 [Chara braunii]
MAGLLDEAHNLNDVLLDFRTAFHGSVFEKYHVVPVQVATLEAFYYVDVGNTADFFGDLSEFLIDPGSADLLKRDRDAFIEQFGECINEDLRNAGTMSLPCAIVDLSKDFLEESSEFFEEISKKAEAGGCDDWVESFWELEVRLVELALSHSNDYRAKIFHRSGMDVVQESDAALATDMFDFCRNWQQLTTRKVFHKIWRVMMVHFIDFDMVGENGERFPLRMRMLDLIEEEAFDEWGWFAEVRDRETNILIARADGSSQCQETRLDIVAANTVNQRYKPHGDVCTLTRTSGRFRHFHHYNHEQPDGYDLEEWDEDFYESDDRQTQVLSRIPPEEKELILEEIGRLRKNSFCRSHDHYISYSSELEFERLIPVAARLSSLHFLEVFSGRPCDHFDAVVRRFELCTSTLEESQQRDRERSRENINRFRHLLKGTCWEQLPEDLIMRILGLVVPTQRHRVG